VSIRRNDKFREPLTNVTHGWVYRNSWGSAVRGNRAQDTRALDGQFAPMSDMPASIGSALKRPFAMIPSCRWRTSGAIREPAAAVDAGRSRSGLKLDYLRAGQPPRPSIAAVTVLPIRSSNTFLFASLVSSKVPTQLLARPGGLHQGIGVDGVKRPVRDELDRRPNQADAEPSEQGA
jgi:hypothetical protein